MQSLFDAGSFVADPERVAVALSLVVTGVAFARWIVAAGDDWLRADDDEDEDDERPDRRPPP